MRRNPGKSYRSATNGVPAWLCSIFDGKMVKRILFHLLLWSLYLLIEFVVNLPHYHDTRELFVMNLFFLPVIALPFYFISYLLVPRLLWKGRKRAFWMACIVVLLVVMILRIQWSQWYWWFESGEMLHLPASKTTKNLFRDYAVIALGVCLKIIWDWDKKDRLATRLHLEKRDAELQFLQAQIHPHFLFNTLNNLYGLALKNSPQTPESILKLSGLLDFILYECNAAYIPVQKEIDLIAHYIELERLRFGKQLALNFEHEIGQGKAMIAPLLLLPFVENAFKHGASRTSGQKVYVSISLTVRSNLLAFQVENSKSKKPDDENGNRGIGLRNVEKRLELLYPGRYTLQKTEAEEKYSIALELQLS
ncbi:MAG: sensor histidine kinase [Saprospiraceae bacterium]